MSRPTTCEYEDCTLDARDDVWDVNMCFFHALDALLEQASEEQLKTLVALHWRPKHVALGLKIADTVKDAVAELELGVSSPATPDKCIDCGAPCAGERCFVHAAWHRHMGGL